MSIVDEMVVQIQTDLNVVMDSTKKVETPKDAITVVREVIMRVEKLSLDFKGITGEQKKDVAVKLVNTFVNIPVMPEWMEAKVFSYVIDTVVDVLNKYFGPLWAKIAKDETAT